MAPEEPIFSESAIFYNYLFDLGVPTNPLEAGRKILNQNYSLALSNPASDTVELSEIFRFRFNLRQSMMGLSQSADTLQKRGLRALSFWLLRNPRTLIELSKAWLKSKTKKGVSEQTRSDVPPDKDSKPKPRDALRTAIGDLDQQMEHIQAIAALYNLSDQTLFSELYLSQVPFVRLVLQPIRVTVEGKEHDLSVALLVHRTGIAKLTFHLNLLAPMTTDELIQLRLLSKIRVTKMTVPDAVMASSAISSGLVGPRAIKKFLRKQTKQGKQEEYEFDVSKEERTYTLGDVADWYRTTVTATLLSQKLLKRGQIWKKLRTPDWHAYPIYFIREISPSCRFASDFKNRYPKQLAGILLAFKSWRNLTPAYVENSIAHDRSLTTGESFYLGQGHAAAIYYEGYERRLERKAKGGSEIDWHFDYAQRSGLLDVLLIQAWILHVLDRKTSALPASLKSLNKLKRELLLALGEYLGITVSYGSAQEIIRDGQNVLRINSALEAIKFKLGNLEKIIEVEESLRRYRRDLFLRLVVTAATLLFGLSGATQVISVISSWSRPPWTIHLGLVGQLINDLLSLIQRHPHYSTLILYLVLVFLILPVMLWSIWPSRPRAPIERPDQSGTEDQSGFVWPTRLKVRLVEDKRKT